MPLTDPQFERYARHLILDEVGEEGQEKLMASRVLVVGAGGLGSPVLMYLAAAGIGTLGIIDDDAVDLSNLQRQIIHSTANIGTAKVKSALESLGAINPEVRVTPHHLRLTAANAREIAAEYDLVCDGSDNFATRYLLNDACYLDRKPLVAASLLRFEGQLSTFKAYDGKTPCYRCLFREPPPPDLVPRCEQAGILGSVAGVLGTLQATEAIKELLGLGRSLAGRLLIYDALEGTTRTIKVPRDPACPLCGERPTIRDLSAHA
ncbi:MAG TPA: molybdopterin-synthase adenylyltransferase MoeB [Alphaproteobacteria bacterium]|nr:molybdopterin-synthase adenylyltransferase MoeB [Alphaproteobacteria bacterium]